MKQGDAKYMAIALDGLDVYDVESVRIIFKQGEYQTDEILKEAIWKADEEGSTMERTGNVFRIFWSMEDTYLFHDGNFFYADYQIKLKNSNEMPSVARSRIKMSSTLFSEEEALQ